MNLTVGEFADLFFWKKLISQKMNLGLFNLYSLMTYISVDIRALYVITSDGV